MAHHISPDITQQKIANLVIQALKNTTATKAFMDGAKAALTGAGLAIPADVEVQVFQNSAAVWHVVRQTGAPAGPPIIHDNTAVLWNIVIPPQQPVAPALKDKLESNVVAGAAWCA